MKQEYSYVGFDIHKKTIALCVMDCSGNIQQRKTIRSRREDLTQWISHEAPERWMGAMEATMFSGWIYDTIHKHNQEIYVGNAMLLRYIAHTKRKNDHTRDHAV